MYLSLTSWRLELKSAAHSPTTGKKLFCDHPQPIHQGIPDVCSFRPALQLVLTIPVSLMSDVVCGLHRQAKYSAPSHMSNLFQIRARKFLTSIYEYRYYMESLCEWDELHVAAAVGDAAAVQTILQKKTGKALKSEKDQVRVLWIWCETSALFCTFFIF